MLGEYQEGFRRDRSTVDQIFTMRKKWKNIGEGEYRYTSFIY